MDMINRQLLWGIDIVQLKALLAASLRMEWRQQLRKGKKQRLSPLVRSLLVYTGMSVMMGLNLVWRTTLTSYCMFTLSYTMMMATLAIIMEFYQVLLLPDDLDILLHRPVSSTTYFIARAIHLIFYILFIGAALGTGPAFLGLILPDTGWLFPLRYLGVTFLALIFTAGMMLWIYTLLIRFVRMEKFKSLLAWFQLIIVFGLIFIYQVIARSGMSGESHKMELASWMQWTPPGWFVRLIQTDIDPFNTHSSVQVMAVSVGVIVFGLFSLRRLSMDYLGHLSEIQAESSRKSRKDTVRQRVLVVPHVSVFRKLHPETRAGWDLAWYMVRRDRSVQMSMIFLAAFPLVFFALMLKDIQIDDPFLLRLAGPLPMYFHYMVFFAVFLSHMMLHSIAYVKDYEARWIYTLAPWTDPARFMQGVRWRVFSLFIFPVYCLLTLGFLYYIPWDHALQVGLFVLLLGLISYAILSLNLKSLPFSKERIRGERTERFGFIIYGGPLIVMMSLIQNVAYQSQTTWVFLSILLLILFAIMEFIVVKRLRRLHYLPDEF